MLNVFEYAWIYLNKESSEYGGILNVQSTESWRGSWENLKGYYFYTIRKKHQLKTFRSHLEVLAYLVKR